jgi:hypothetical protein
MVGFRMKPWSLICLLFAALAGFSCERHSWEDTKVLHHHGKHAGHGDNHAGEDTGAGEKAPAH